MAVSARKPVAFLCHSSVNAGLAERLAQDLQAHGIEVFFAPWAIRAGDSLRRKIEAGIDEATHFLALLTPTSLLSEWVQTELDTALVNRINGRCRLIPLLSGVLHDDVPATLRGLVHIDLADYETAFQKLVADISEMSVKRRLGEPPAWARERPLDASGLSPDAQRLAAWINRHSELGNDLESFQRDDLMKELDLPAERAGMAASELEKVGWVTLHRDSSSGPGRFARLRPTGLLFIETDPVLRSWRPADDAHQIACELVNKADAGGDVVTLADIDQRLGWGPRRFNPAADYLKVNGHVNALDARSARPYSYMWAGITPATRQFAASH